MNNRWRSLALALLIACGWGLAAPSWAQEEPAGPPAAPVPWSSLSPEQQRLLSSFNSQWNSLPPARQQALAHGSERWMSMSPGERDQAHERFQRWQTLPPSQRQALRSRWQHFQSLTPSQQQAVRENFHRFQQLSPQRRQMLREQWRNATPSERQQMVEHARESHQGHPMQGHAPMPMHAPHH